jgi:hypothetical protein
MQLTITPREALEIEREPTTEFWDNESRYDQYRHKRTVVFKRGDQYYRFYFTLWWGKMYFDRPTVCEEVKKIGPRQYAVVRDEFKQ